MGDEGRLTDSKGRTVDFTNTVIIMTNSLGASQLEKICQKTMVGVKKRLAGQGIRLVLEKSGTEAILNASYDREYGARPVERYLEQTVVTKLSKMLIGGELSSGYTVFIEGIPHQSSDDDSFDMVEPEKKRAKTLTYRVEPFPADMVLNSDGDLVSETAMET